MKNNQKFGLYAWPNKQKAKDGKYPVYIRISVDSKVATVATRFYINPAHWDKRNGKLKLQAPNHQQINAYLDRSKNIIQQEFLNHAATGKMVSPLELKNAFLGIVPDTDERTFLDVIDYHNKKFEDLVRVGKMSKSTLGKYIITKNKVATFLKKNYRVKDLSLAEVKYSFITDFEHYMLTKENIHQNTAYKNIKNLKKIMRMCVDLEWLDVNPFDRFKCSYRAPERVVLTSEEIGHLINYNFKNRRLEEIRDVFVFCCYTGFAYAEVANFKSTDVTVGIDGEQWLTTHRRKTGTRESVPLLPVALSIVRKYQDHEKCRRYGKLLPVKANQVYNNYLKEIAAICGINKNLTSHIARHTFATTVTLSNGVPIETVSKMLGHTRLATTQIYAKVLDQKVSSDMKDLKDKLSGNEKNSKNKNSA